MNNIRGCVSQLTVLAFIATVALCQSPQTASSRTPPKFTSVPPIEEIELYFQFFQYHQSLINANQATEAANPGQGAALDQQMAALLNVDIKELPAVIANMQQVTGVHANIAAKRAAGPVAQSPLTPGQQISQLEFQRVRTTVEGVRTLSQSLTPASWAGIHGYIVGAFKAQYYKKH